MTISIHRTPLSTESALVRALPVEDRHGFVVRIEGTYKTVPVWAEVVFTSSRILVPESLAVGARDSVRYPGQATELARVIQAIDLDAHFQAFDPVTLTRAGERYAHRVLEAAYWACVRASRERLVPVVNTMFGAVIGSVTDHVWDRDKGAVVPVQVPVRVRLDVRRQPDRPVADALGAVAVVLDKDVRGLDAEAKADAIRLVCDYMRGQTRAGRVLETRYADEPWGLASIKGKLLFFVEGRRHSEAMHTLGLDQGKYALAHNRSGLVRGGVVMGRTGGEGTAIEIALPQGRLLPAGTDTPGQDGVVVVSKDAPFPISQGFFWQVQEDGTHVFAKGTYRWPVYHRGRVEAEGCELVSQMGRSLDPSRPVQFYPLREAGDSTASANLQGVVFSQADLGAGYLDKVRREIQDRGMATFTDARGLAFIEAGVPAANVVDGRDFTSQLYSWSGSHRYGSMVALIGKDEHGQDLIHPDEVLLPLRTLKAWGERGTVLVERNPHDASGDSVFEAQAESALYLYNGRRVVPARHGIGISHACTGWHGAKGDGDGDDATVELKSRSHMGELYRLPNPERRAAAALQAKLLPGGAEPPVFLRRHGLTTRTPDIVETAIALSTGRADTIGIVATAALDLAVKGGLTAGERALRQPLFQVAISAIKHPHDEAETVRAERRAAKTDKAYRGRTSVLRLVQDVKRASGTPASIRALAQITPRALPEDPTVLEYHILRLATALQAYAAWLRLFERDRSSRLPREIVGAARAQLAQDLGAESGPMLTKARALYRDWAKAVGQLAQAKAQSLDEDADTDDFDVRAVQAKRDLAVATLQSLVARGLVDELAVLAVDAPAHLALQVVSPDTIRALGFRRHEIVVRMTSRPKTGRVYETTTLAAKTTEDQRKLVLGLGDRARVLGATANAGHYLVHLAAPEVLEAECELDFAF